MTDPVPSAKGIIATAGTEPQNIVVQALTTAKDQLVEYLGRPDVELELAQGIFAFANINLPTVASNPIVSWAEKAILAIISARQAKEATTP